MKKRIYTYLYKKPTKEEKSRADWVAEGARTEAMLNIRALKIKTNDETNKNNTTSIRNATS
jgi:hypothetical protein